MIKKMVLFCLALAVVATFVNAVFAAPTKVVRVVPVVVVERQDVVTTNIYARHRPIFGGTVIREKTVVVPRYIVKQAQKIVAPPPARVLAPAPSLR